LTLYSSPDINVNLQTVNNHTNINIQINNERSHISYNNQLNNQNDIRGKKILFFYIFNYRRRNGGKIEKIRRINEINGR
jgi:hypothetical protein